MKRVTTISRRAIYCIVAMLCLSVIMPSCGSIRTHAGIEHEYNYDFDGNGHHKKPKKPKKKKDKKHKKNKHGKFWW